MTYLAATAAGLFSVKGTGGRELLAEGGFRHVVAADEGAVALGDDGTLWSVDDDGATQYDDLAGREATCLVLDGGVTWVGTAGAHLLQLDEGGVRRVDAFEGVAGRDRWNTPWGAPPDVRSLDVDDASTVYVNVHVGGIVRGDAGGATWTPVGEIDWDVHQVATVPEYPDCVVAALGAGGMALSTDRGETWEVEQAGLATTYCRAITVSGDDIVISASEGHHGHGSALYRRALEGSSFERCWQGLPDAFDGNIDTHCLAAYEDIVLAAAPDGVLYVSANHGNTWRAAARGLGQIRAVALM